MSIFHRATFPSRLQYQIAFRQLHRDSESWAIRNVGTTTVTFLGWEISGANSGDFNETSGDPPCSGSLLAGASCNITVTFDPSKTGSEAATYKVFDNSPGSPQTLALSGKGQ